MAIDINYRYSTYPKVIIPENISKLFDKEYSEIEICKELNIEYPKLSILRLPSEPQKEISVRKEKTKFKFRGGCFTIIAIPIFIFSVFGLFSLISEGVFWAVPIFIFWLYILNKNFGIELETYIVYENEIINDEVFNEMMRKYNSDCLSITKKNDEIKTEHSIKLKETRKIISEKYDEISKTIFFKQLKPKVGLKKMKSTNKRGRSELFFLTKLYDTFHNSISIDVTLDDNSQYYPDFVIIDNETKFHIDIEIDEPYAVENGIPIHHDRSNDDARNSYFEEINWGIIRFTEKQIIQCPQECCELIAQVLKKIKNKNKIITHNVDIENQWSYEEALVMKENDYRNSYLPKDMKIKVKYKKEDDYNSFNSYDDDDEDDEDYNDYYDLINLR